MTTQSSMHSLPRSQELSFTAKAVLLWLLPLILMALVGAGAELYVTRNGAGASGDSVQYIDGARNILSGHGYGRTRGSGEVVPTTQFPPFYSIVLAGIGLFGGDLFASARILNALLFGINVALTGLLIYRLSRSILASLLAAGLVLTANNLLLIHAWVMSEPLYITLTLISFHCLLAYQKNRSDRLLGFTGLLIGITAVTRYVGFSLIAAAPLWVFFFTGRPNQKNWKGAFIVGLPSLVPAAIWFIRNALVSTTLAGRTFIFHAPIPDLVQAALDELSYWVQPGRFRLPERFGLIILGALVVICLAIFLWTEFSHQAGKSRDRQALGQDHFLALFLFYILSYIGVLILDAVWLDASLDPLAIKRFLIPVFVVLLMWVIVLIQRLNWFKFGNLARFVFLIGGLGLLAIYAGLATSFIRNPGTVFGYTDIKVLLPEVVDGLRAIDPQRPILADDYEKIYFLAGRPPYATPRNYDNARASENADYQQKMAEARQLLQNGAVLVVIEAEENHSESVITLVKELVPWKKIGGFDFYVDPKYLKQ